MKKNQTVATEENVFNFIESDVYVFIDTLRQLGCAKKFEHEEAMRVLHAKFGNSISDELMVKVSKALEDYGIVEETKQETKKETEMEIKKIKNAEWEIHDNITDGNLPQYVGDSQLVYKSAKATIDGQDIEVVYSDERGYELLVDGHNVQASDLLADEDADTYTIVEAVEEVLDDDLTCLKDVHKQCLWALADEVVYSEDLEVRSYVDADGETVYIAKQGEEIFDHYDYIGHATCPVEG